MATTTKTSASGLFSHSRTVFLQTDGMPLHFYIRPGPTKASLLPLILHGGGAMCRVEEPGVILLCESEEEDDVSSNYIRARFVRDCVQQNRQLALADYRVARPPPATASTSACTGRMTYSKREDVAILMYVREYGFADSVRGNAMWREMERVQLTQHTWQSMRNRYLRFLRGREQQYNLDSRSVIPSAFHEGAEQRPPRSEAGKTNTDSVQHASPKSNKDEPFPGDKVSDGVNSEEEFNIFPIAIWEFENDETSEQQTKTSVVAEVENVPQGQQREMDKSAQVSLGEHCRQKKGAMGELNVDNEQIETDGTEEVSLSAPCAKKNGSTANVIMDSQQMGGEDPLEVSLGDYHTKKKETLSEFVMNNKQSELDSDELSLPTASQDEVESATKDISILMQTHDLDLYSATQLLLKNNGELAAALHFMETGHRPDGYPIWTHQDDLDLEKIDSKVQESLVQKFGAENLAKRIAFRKN